LSLFSQLNKSATLIVVLLLFLLSGSLPASAQKIVLMPMADLSKGANGVNFTFTKAVETTLKQLGIELVSRNDVMLFMAGNKVRTYQYLDSYLVKKIGTEFDSPLVLIGTIAELDAADASIGISFTAFDTADGNPVWAASDATSIREQVRVLGVGQPETSTDLARPLLKQMLAPLAKLAYAAEISDSRDYQLLGLSLFPGYVQGGQPLEATLKIRFLGQRPTLIAAESAAGKSYLQYDRRSDSYHGKWFAPSADGSYPVDLRIEWGREQTVQKVQKVASFDVINAPPGLQMEIKKAIPVGQRLAVRDHVLILPRVEDVRPLAGWALEIVSEHGDSRVYEEYEGDIPERMIWEGRSSDGFMMANGTYTISLHIWDLAGNQSSASQTLVLQASAPKIQARITHSDGKAFLNLSSAGQFEFPITAWEADLQSLGGERLLKTKGQVLPVALEFKPVTGEEYVQLSLQGEDLLGNRLQVKRQKLPIVEMEKTIKEQKAESWVPDF